MVIKMDGHDYLTVFWYVLGIWWALFALAVAAIIHVSERGNVGLADTSSTSLARRSPL